MKAKYWALGFTLVGVASLAGLIQAGATPFSTSILTDDLGNSVNGSAPDPDEWGGSDEDTSGANNGHGNNADGVDSSNPGKDNNGHGNNADGVDSSNPGKGKGGPNGAVDESCDGTGECIDDENGGGSTSSGSSSDGSKGKGKKK